jgi:hypothetical protein
MGIQDGPGSYTPEDAMAVSAGCRELRIYRRDGTLSVIYVTTFGSDAKAILEAEKLAGYGYRIDVMRDGMRIDRIAELGRHGTSNYH